MLCVAGTETMFAAMGHFSQPSIALAFGCFAYPCLIIAYLGQVGEGPWGMKCVGRWVRAL